MIVVSGSGLIGKALKKVLPEDTKYININLESTNSHLKLLEVFENLKPSIYIHAAGYNGGIEFNKKFPFDIYFKTVAMGVSTLEAAKMYAKLDKFVYLAPSCSYGNSFDLVENRYWDGKPHDSIECHGLAKRAVIGLGRQLEKVTQTKFLVPVLNNCFGPHDRFESPRAKVVSAMIKKVDDAIKRKEILEFWGDGSPTRQFLYSKDAAKCILKVIENFDSGIVNISPKEVISIKQLAEIIMEEMGYTGKVQWNTSMPNGQDQKTLNTRLFESKINFKFTPFRQAIKETIQWYQSQN